MLLTGGYLRRVLVSPQGYTGRVTAASDIHAHVPGANKGNARVTQEITYHGNYYDARGVYIWVTAAGGRHHANIRTTAQNALFLA